MKYDVIFTFMVDNMLSMLFFFSGSRRPSAIPILRIRTSSWIYSSKDWLTR